MKCSNMMEIGGRYVSCKQCMPCRINKKREWTGKILLEALHSPNSSSFITLTYNEEHYPEDGSLRKEDTSAYLNRLRDKSNLGAFRYFCVGEYGEKTGRAHYHMAIFNAPPEIYEDAFRDAWHTGGKDKSKRESLGFVHCGEITRASSSYISGYTTKKLTQADNPRLDGKNPEYATFSKNPPLGYAGMNHIYDLMHTRSGAAALAEYKDVPNGFTLDGKTYPFSNYWRKWLRAEMGVTNPPVNASWEIDYETFLREQQNADQKAVKLNRKIKAGYNARTF